MTALDIIVIILVGTGLVFGLRRGFVAEVISLATWVAIIFAIRLFHAPLSEALIGPIGTVSGANVLAFAAIFLGVYIVGKMLASRITGGLRRTALGALDRLLGGGFGALKGLLGVVLIFLAGSLIYDTIWGRAAPRPEWVRDARTYPLVYASADLVIDFVEARRGVQPGRPAREEEAERP